MRSLQENRESPGAFAGSTEAVGRLAQRPEETLSEVRLVATDLDGTLLDPAGRITPRTAAAVRAARESGIYVVAVTARPPQATWELAREAGLGPLGVCSNGAVLVETDCWSILEVHTLSADLICDLLSVVRATVPGVLLAADCLAGFRYEPGFFEQPMAWQEELVELDDLRGAAAAGCLTLVARHPLLSAAELIAKLEGEVAGKGSVTAAGADWTFVGSAQVSKAFAVERLCSHLGVAQREVVAIGDNYNDLPLLAWAATAMAPANAIPEVLAAAQRVLPPNSEEGVALLLEQLVEARA